MQYGGGEALRFCVESAFITPNLCSALSWAVTSPGQSGHRAFWDDVPWKRLSSVRLCKDWAQWKEATVWSNKALPLYHTQDYYADILWAILEGPRQEVPVTCLSWGHPWEKSSYDSHFIGGGLRDRELPVNFLTEQGLNPHLHYYNIIIVQFFYFNFIYCSNKYVLFR